MEKFLEGLLPVVLMATQEQQNDIADAAADATISAVQHTETKLDNVTVKAAIALVRRYCDRVETQI